MDGLNNTCVLAQSLSCARLCNHMECSTPGSSVHGISQARILEWVVLSFSRYLPNPGIEPTSADLQADSLPMSHTRNSIVSYISTSQLTSRSTEKAMAPHSSTLAWKIPWREEPGRLQSMGSLRVGHD